MNKFREWLLKPVDALPVRVFRSLFGIAMMMEMIYMLSNDAVEKLVLLPQVRIPYDFFEWLSPLPAPLMRALPALMLIAAFLLTIGRWTRVAGFSFFIMHFYFLMLDKSYYNNHMYLYSLFGLLFSLEEETKRKDGVITIPNWVWRVIQMQVLIVYFYGGLAKLNADWIFRHEPVVSILKAPQTSWILESKSLAPLVTNLLVWGGLLYDLGVPVLLMIRRTRYLALILCLIFHISNIFIFNTGESGTIGEFPLVMIASCVLFFDPEIINKWLGKLPVNPFRTKPSQPARKKMPGKQQAATVYEPGLAYNPRFVLPFVLFYCSVQLLLPLRHYLVTDNVLWTAEANNFAWRMKIRSADFTNRMWVRAEPGGERTELHPIGFINSMQYSHISQDPIDMMKFAKGMIPILKKRGIHNPVIEVTMELGINGRPKQLAIDSTLNLAAVKYTPWKHAEWILPEQNP
jgi:vitamin K-dependent gamma-carboxylase